MLKCVLAYEKGWVILDEKSLTFLKILIIMNKQNITKEGTGYGEKCYKRYDCGGSVKADPAVFLCRWQVVRQQSEQNV